MSERSRDGGFSRYKHPTSPFTPGGNRQPVAAADGRATPAFPEAAELVVEYRWPLAALAAGLFLIWVLQVCPHPPAPPGGASTTAIGTASRAFEPHIMSCADVPQLLLSGGFESASPVGHVPPPPPPLPHFDDGPEPSWPWPAQHAGAAVQPLRPAGTTGGGGAAVLVAVGETVIFLTSPLHPC